MARQDLQVKESGVLNQSRLEVLRVRDEIVKGCQEKCRRELLKIQDYPKLLKKLIEQGADLLKVNEVIVQYCGEDEAAVKQAVGQLQGVKATLHETLLHKEDCIGGVVVYAKDRKIYIENTLAKRLQLAYKKRAPEVSALLFQDHSSLW